MIVIAIIGILASIAVPQYKTYSQRTRFSEVVLATTPYATAAEIAVSTGRITTLTALDAGSFGIPDDLQAGQTVGTNVHTVSLADGLITATGTSTVDGAVFALQAELLANGGVLWTPDPTVEDACQGLGLC